MAADHAGTTLTWAGRVATITAPDGATRTLTMRDFRTLRGSAGGPAPVTEGEHPTPEPDAGPPAEPRTPKVGHPSERPASDPVNRSISTQSVRDALSEQMLAKLIRDLSRAISEWDGAGERGVFSAIESAEIAGLLYDQTIDLVVRRFAGDVNRFKAAIAMLIILAGKGRIHAAAIAERNRRSRAGLPPVAVLPVQPEGAPEPEPVSEPEPTAAGERIILPYPGGNGHVPAVQPDAGGAWIPLSPAMLAERQRQWANEQAPVDYATAAVLRDSPPSAIDRIFGE